MLNLINDLEQKGDELISLIRVSVKTASENQKWYEQLQDFDRKLKFAKDDLFNREKEFEKKQLEVEQQKDFIKKSFLEIKAKESTVQVKLEQLDKLRKEVEDLDKKKAEIEEKTRLLDEKTKQTKEIDDKLKIIDEKERKIEREKAVARTRKQVLDQQQIANEREKERLQKLAQRFS